MPNTLSFASLVLLLGGAITFSPSAKADERFDCWQPNATLTQSRNEGGYWTKERRDRAIPFDDEFSTSHSNTLKVGEATPANVANPPFKFGGKLFFHRDGADRVASAQFAGQDGDDILLTAAHTMFKSGKATNVSFFRAYTDSGNDENKFDIDNVAVLKAWERVSGDRPSAARAGLDYAVLHTTTASGVGHLPVATNAILSQVHIMGYPVNHGDGKRMYTETTTNQARIDDSYYAVPTSFGPGASGGAWFTDADDTLRAVSVVSGGSSEANTFVRGPVFTATTIDMLAYVKGGCH